MSNWTVSFTKEALKQLAKLDRPIQLIISAWIEKHLVNTSDPRLFGKALTGNLKGLWRYRIGDYRIICDIKDNNLIIQIIEVGHRKEIYI